MGSRRIGVSAKRCNGEAVWQRGMEPVMPKPQNQELNRFLKRVHLAYITVAHLANHAVNTLEQFRIVGNKYEHDGIGAHGP